jgi:hypothetical protein
MIVTLVDVEDDIQIGQWAQENCPSFTGWLVVDTFHDPDADSIEDFRFYFTQEQDAMIFLMRWQGSNNASI